MKKERNAYAKILLEGLPEENEDKHSPRKGKISNQVEAHLEVIPKLVPWNSSRKISAWECTRLL